MEKTIYDLELHETIRTPENGNVQVMRVPGGWIYDYFGRGVFVPYNNEFETNTYLD
jgi:hypothetical protein